MTDEERKPTFQVGSKVQLKSDCADVYVRAFGGSVGWVRDTKFDEFGFEKILIEWDKSWWNYNHQPDSYTYANHFILKEPPGPTPKPSRKKKVTPIAMDPELEAYMAEIQKGFEAIAGSEGFAIFIAKRVPTEQPGQSMIVPEVYAASHSGEADAVLGITIQEHLTETFQDLTMMILDMYGDGDYDDHEEDPTHL